MMSKKIMGLGLLLAVASFSLVAKNDVSTDDMLHGRDSMDADSRRAAFASSKDTTATKATNKAKNDTGVAKAAVKNAARLNGVKGSGFDFAVVAKMVVTVKAKAKDGTTTEKWGLKNGKSSMALPASLQGGDKPGAAALQASYAKWTAGQKSTFQGVVKG